MEDVLVDIGHLPRVGVDAGLACEEADKQRPPGPGQADADARLEDPIALGDDPPGRVKDRAVKGMGHGADELPRDIARQLRVRVERDHVLDGREDPLVPHNLREVLAADSPKEPVELEELPPLALVAHPQALAIVPEAGPVDQVELVLRRGQVFPIEHLDSRPGPAQERAVTRKLLRRRIPEVREEREMEVVIAVRQVVDLQGLDEPVDGLGA